MHISTNAGVASIGSQKEALLRPDDNCTLARHVSPRPREQHFPIPECTCEIILLNVRQSSR